MEPGAHWFYFLSRFVAWVLCVILFRHRGVGLQKVPAEGGFLLAVNHCSFLDPVLAGISLKRPLSFMARSSLFGPFPFGAALRGMNALPLEREGVGLSAFRAVLDHLDQGGGVLVFPEGTRSSDGKLKRFKGGVLKLARMAKVPVVPAMVVGSHRALGRGKWIPRPKNTEIRFGEPLEFLDEAEDDSAALDRLKKAMVRLAPEISGDGVPVANG